LRGYFISNDFAFSNSTFGENREVLPILGIALRQKKKTSKKGRPVERIKMGMKSEFHL
jgi:hypothetical protein